jgi:O-antigen ligase
MDNKYLFEEKFQALIVALLLLSFFLNAFPHVNTIRDTSFYLALCGFLIFSFKNKIKICFISPLLAPMVLLVAWAALTTLTAYEVGDSLDSYFSHLIKYLILMLVTVNILDTPRKIEWLFATFVLSTMIFCVGAVIYFYIFQPNPWSTRIGFPSMAHNIICFGANLAAIFAFFILRSTPLKWLKIFMFSCLFVFIAQTFLTQSRGGVLALTFSFVFIFLLEKKYHQILIFLIAVFILLTASPVKERFLAHESASNTHRLGTIHYYIEVFKDHPIMGIGFAIDTFKNEKIYANKDYFERIPEKYRNDIFTTLPHSMFLSIIVRMGVVGLAIYLYILSVYFYMGIKVYLNENRHKHYAVVLMGSMVMFLIGGMFEPVFIHYLDTIFFSLLAMNVVLWWSSPRASMRRIKSSWRDAGTL